MVAPVARDPGTFSLHRSGARCRRDIAPRKRPRYRRGLWTAPFADEARGRERAGLKISKLEIRSSKQIQISNEGMIETITLGRFEYSSISLSELVSNFEFRTSNLERALARASSILPESEQATRRQNPGPGPVEVSPRCRKTR